MESGRFFDKISVVVNLNTESISDLYFFKKIARFGVFGKTDEGNSPGTKMRSNPVVSDVPSYLWDAQFGAFL